MFSVKIGRFDTAVLDYDCYETDVIHTGIDFEAAKQAALKRLEAIEHFDEFDFRDGDYDAVKVEILDDQNRTLEDYIHVIRMDQFDPDMRS